MASSISITKPKIIAQNEKEISFQIEIKGNFIKINDIEILEDMIEIEIKSSKHSSFTHYICLHSQIRFNESKYTISGENQNIIIFHILKVDEEEWTNIESKNKNDRWEQVGVQAEKDRKHNMKYNQSINGLANLVMEESDDEKRQNIIRTYTESNGTKLDLSGGLSSSKPKKVKKEIQKEEPANTNMIEYIKTVQKINEIAKENNGDVSIETLSKYMSYDEIMKFMKIYQQQQKTS